MIASTLPSFAQGARRVFNTLLCLFDQQPATSRDHAARFYVTRYYAELAAAEYLANQVKKSIECGNFAVLQHLLTAQNRLICSMHQTARDVADCGYLMMIGGEL